MALDYFTPEIWSAQLLVNLHNDLVYGSPSVINRDYQGEIARYGDTVRINAIGGVNVQDYVKNTDFTERQVLSSAQQALVIDQAKMFNFEIDDIDEAQNNPSVMGAAMREAAFSLGNVADQFLSSEMASELPVGGTANGNYLGDVNITTDGLVYEALVDMARVLDENNAPPAGRWAVVNPLVYAELLKDARFTSFGTEVNRATIRSRAVGSIAGFTILVSNQTPLDGTDPVVLGGSTMATTFAQQISTVEAYRPENRFTDAVKGLHLYGSKVVRPELLTGFTAVTS